LPPFIRERLADGGRDLTVLVLRFGALGDILRTLPAARLVRSAWPRARLVWAVDERWRIVLDGHADLDRVLALPRFERGERRPGLLGWVRQWRSELRGVGADLVLDFHGNLRSGVAGRLSSATVRVGHDGHQQREGNRFLTTHRVGAGPRRISRLERNFNLLRALGIRCDPPPDPGLVPGRDSLDRARDVASTCVGPDRPYAVLAPGASRTQAYKRPPASLLAAAVAALDEVGLPTVVVHGPGEEPDARRVVDRAPGARLAAPTDLATLSALIREARIFVGGDSGPLHLACAMGCPVVGLYGPTDPVVNSPWGVPHRTVFPPGTAYTGVKRRDRRIGRFESIPPAAVRTAVEELIHALGGPGRGR
jgi:ADP-heptose:LPS heptosyltransferase